MCAGITLFPALPTHSYLSEFVVGYLKKTKNKAFVSDTGSVQVIEHISASTSLEFSLPFECGVEQHLACSLYPFLFVSLCLLVVSGKWCCYYREKFKKKMHLGSFYFYRVDTLVILLYIGTFLSP